VTFEQTLTLLAVVLGPAGIWFGWWLSDRSATKRAEREAEAASRAAELDRVLRLIRLARRLESEARSLAHGMYLKSTRGVDQTQMKEMIGQFNDVRGQYREATLEVKVLGPKWLVGPADSIHAQGQDLTALIFRMQVKVTNDYVKDADTRITAMDAAVDELVSEAERRLPTR
jgi:hypothetical protein